MAKSAINEYKPGRLNSCLSRGASASTNRIETHANAKLSKFNARNSTRKGHKQPTKKANETIRPAAASGIPASLTTATMS